MFNIFKDPDNKKYYLGCPYSTMWYLPENKISGYLSDFFKENENLLTYNLECINETFQNYFIEIIFLNETCEVLWFLAN
jgi:hypothetical protein